MAGHQEEKNIYESLKNFTYQTAVPSEFEICLFVNHPNVDREGNKIKPDKTISEINRFKKDFPNMNVKVMQYVIPFDKAKIGYARKMLNDAVLLRHHKRGKDVKDLIKVSNDADNCGVSPEYINNFISKFEDNPDVDGMLGQLDWDPESYVKYPAIHIGTRLFQYLNAAGRMNTDRMSSSGANFAFKSSIYSGIGGYLDNLKGAEDIAIGEAIRAARKSTDTISFAGARVSRLYTSSRRAIDALKNNLSPLEQWSKEFSAFDDEIRRFELAKDSTEVDYDNPEEIKELKEVLEYIIDRTLNQYELGEQIGKLNRYYKKAINLLGIKYELTPDNRVRILNIDKVVKSLKKYKKEWKKILNLKSGKTGARIAKI